MARLNDDMQVAAKCQCGHTTVGAAYPVVCAKCQKVVHKPLYDQGWPCSKCGAKAYDGRWCRSCIVDAQKDEFERSKFLSASIATLGLLPGEADPVNHPVHYTSHASGIEVIQITEHMGFCLGNAVKYILRCDLKGNAIEDLEKSIWYIKREIERRKGRVNEAKP